MTDPARVTIRRPDDWHLHLRDGAVLEAVLPFTARVFARAIVMPNLVPPITSVAAALAYRDRIMAALPDGVDFTPLMTCYLTDTLDPDEVERGFRDGVFAAAKLYPAGATTNSEFGVTSMAAVRPVLERMQRLGMPLLCHGEVVDPAVDVFDREAAFIDRVLIPLLRDHPELRVVMEHVTTADAVDFVMASEARLGATITPHHLMINRNAIFQGGIRPHMYCLPIAKRERHRLALRRAAVSGDSRFFLGTDSAPHVIARKEAECGCAGLFNAPTALECYATVFAEEAALDRLEAFASLNGPAFYRMPVNDGTVTLARADWTPVETAAVAGDPRGVRVFKGGETLPWRVA